MTPFINSIILQLLITPSSHYLETNDLILRVSCLIYYNILLYSLSFLCSVHVKKMSID